MYYYWKGQATQPPKKNIKSQAAVEDYDRGT